MQKIFRDFNFKDQNLYKSARLILNENNLFSLNLKSRISKLKSIFKDQEMLLNYLFKILNIYFEKIEKPSFFTLYKIAFLLWKIKLNNCLTLKERNNLYLYRNMILASSRLIKTLPIRFNDDNEETYAELKCNSFRIQIAGKNIVFDQFNVFLSNYSLILQIKNLFKSFHWNELLDLTYTASGLDLTYKNSKISIDFNDPYGDEVLIKRLINEGYIKWKKP